MPAVAVAAAVYGGTSIAAAGGLTAMFAANAFGAIAAIGSITAAVGVVTGNKTLTAIGGAMGLVGGIGSLASSQGLLKSAATDIGASELGEVSSVGAGPGEAVSAANTATTVAPTGAVVTETGQATIDTASVEADLAGTVTPPADAANAPAPVDAVAPADVAAAPTGGKGAGLLNQQGPPDVYMQDPPAIGGDGKFYQPILNKLGDIKGWAEKNQMLTYGMMQVGGPFLSGLFDSSAGAKKKLLESQTDYYAANAANTAQQTANMAAPAPVANSTGARPSPFRTTPAPKYAQVGIINGRVA